MIPHYYNYELMKQLNGNKQMTDVWNLPAIARWEKSCGKHATQKLFYHQIIFMQQTKWSQTMEFLGFKIDKHLIKVGNK